MLSICVYPLCILLIAIVPTQECNGTHCSNCNGAECSNCSGIDCSDCNGTDCLPTIETTVYSDLSTGSVAAIVILLLAFAISTVILVVAVIVLRQSNKMKK